MKSIFDLENRLDINNEFKKLLQAFQEERNAVIYSTPYHSREYGSFIDGINNTVFLEWKYRDTFLDVFDYLNFIGIDEFFLENRYYIDESKFLLYLEFILNMAKLACYSDKIKLMPITNAAIENIPRILEKMNYKMEELGDKIIITKRDADVDSILNKVPEDVAEILLEYNDFRIQSNIEYKKKVLKNLDLYIEENIKISSFDNKLDNAIGTVVNKMGVNHPIKEEPYKSFNNKQLLEWYDKCFLMMIHAIRTVEVNKIKEERKELVKK